MVWPVAWPVVWLVAWPVEWPVEWPVLEVKIRYLEENTVISGKNTVI